MRELIVALDLEQSVIEGVYRSKFEDELKANILQSAAVNLRKIADEIDALAKEMRDA